MQQHISTVEPPRSNPISFCIYFIKENVEKLCSISLLWLSDWNASHLSSGAWTTNTFTSSSVVYICMFWWPQSYCCWVSLIEKSLLSVTRWVFRRRGVTYGTRLVLALSWRGGSRGVRYGAPVSLNCQQNWVLLVWNRVIIRVCARSTLHTSL